MSSYLSANQRFQLLETLSTTHFDVLVIGGGITGVGIALDAASRGLKVALVEKKDFAFGTSSRSTKLIHGGLRYLKQGEIGLVREVGKERAIVHQNAPHLVIPEKMLLPLIRKGNYGKLATSVGLWVYDVLAGVKKNDRRKMLNKKQTLAKEPLLNAQHLLGGGYYAEYRTDDARLTISVMKTAVKYGAVCANYCQVERFLYIEDEIKGAFVEDVLTGNKLEIKAKYVVNATGPWVDVLRKQDNSLKGKKLQLTKGVHLVVIHDRFPVKQALYFDAPDGRMIFAIPRGKITYFGTTDTTYTGDINQPETTLEDASYLLKVVNETFPDVNLKLSDVISSWAGLRPLIHEDGKSPSELSRKDEIFISESGFISIAGGKLTGYRKMAQRVVDLLVEKMNIQQTCKTADIKIVGGDYETPNQVSSHMHELERHLERLYLEDLSYGDYLVHNYGHHANTILEKTRHDEGDVEQNLIIEELIFCVENEMTHTLDDFFNRRTGNLYFNPQRVTKYLEIVAHKMKELLLWDDARLEKEIQEIKTQQANLVAFK